MTTLLASQGNDRNGVDRVHGAGADDWHCLVVTRSEDFLFRICFELGAVPQARVTGCVSLFQAWRTAREDFPLLTVVDATLVDEDPDGVLTLAGTMVPGGVLVVLTDDPVEEMRSKWGTTRLIYRHTPENPGEFSGFLKELLLDEGREEPGPSTGRQPEGRSALGPALAV